MNSSLQFRPWKTENNTSMCLFPVFKGEFWCLNCDVRCFSTIFSSQDLAGYMGHFWSISDEELYIYVIHVSRPKFDAKSGSGNQNGLYGKRLSESGNYSTISQIIYMAHVSRPKFDAESEYGNQNGLYGKRLSESGNHSTISPIIYMAHVSRPKFDAKSEYGNQNGLYNLNIIYM